MELSKVRKGTIKSQIAVPVIGGLTYDLNSAYVDICHVIRATLLHYHVKALPLVLSSIT